MYLAHCFLHSLSILFLFFFFFFNDTATTEIYTLSLHDALPICLYVPLSNVSSSPATLRKVVFPDPDGPITDTNSPASTRDRKSTRLNSSHSQISYAVFCLKKKKKK